MSINGSQSSVTSITIPSSIEAGATMSNRYSNAPSRSYSPLKYNNGITNNNNNNSNSSNNNINNVKPTVSQTHQSGSNCTTTVLVIFLLCLQNVFTASVIRYSRGILKERYLVSSIVLIGELIKFIISLSVLYVKHEHYSVISTIRRVSHDISLKHSLALAFPALCYFIQNLLGNAAMDHIDSFTYQSLAQSRILCTALFSVILLRKHITMTQWRALVLLCIGLCLVVWKNDDSSDSSKKVIDSTTSDISSYITSSAYILGCGMMLLHSVFSGLNGVYFECVLKSNDKTNSIFRLIQYIANMFRRSKVSNNKTKYTSNLWHVTPICTTYYAHNSV